MNCQICQSQQIFLFLKRQQVPIYQNMAMPTEDSAKNVMRGNLEMAICEHCGFVFNKAFDKSSLLYNENYDNTQTCSPAFQKYVEDLVNYIVFNQGIKNKYIIEIGCGKGYFIKRLCEVGDNRGVGFDPSYVGPEKMFNGKLYFVKDYYSPDYKTEQTDIIVCRHVIEHIAQPVSLLKTLRKTSKDFYKTKLFIETPCIEWILNNKVFWDFFYEHCSYFSPSSLTTAVEYSGFKVENSRHVFGGQYLWLEAVNLIQYNTIQYNTIQYNTTSIGVIKNMAIEFAKTEEEIKQRWKVKIKNLRNKGKVAIWGAGAKGVTFANLLDPDCELIDCIVDMNPNKQGCFLPGTGHPIVSYRDLPKRNVVTALIMNPNYREENEGILQKAGIKLNLIDLDGEKNEISN